MLFRPMCGGLEESMKKCVKVISMEELKVHIDREYGLTYDAKTTVIEDYCDIPDHRIGWEKTYAVKALWKRGNEMDIVGFTDGKDF